VWYTSSPALADMSCRSRVICVGMLAEPAKCDTVDNLYHVLFKCCPKKCSLIY